MATGTTLIDGALRALQVLAENASHNTDQGTFALATLNRMLESYSNQRSAIFQVQEADHSWPGATATRTIGSGAQFNVAWPIRIAAAGYSSGGKDLPMSVTQDRMVWERIYDKTRAGEPAEILFFDRAYPTGTFHVWPVPSASWTLRLSSWAQLSSIATVGTTVSFPPGYEEFIVWNLAKRLWPTYPTEQTRDYIMAMARESERAIKSPNLFPAPVLHIDPGMTRPRQYDITQDR